MYTPISEYFLKHHSIPKHLLHRIDTLSLGQVMNKNKSKLGTRVKCINQQWDTMERSHNWKISSSPTCPLCQKEIETWQHVCRCQHPDMHRTRSAFLKKFEKDLTYIQTLPELQKIILLLLNSWIQLTPFIYQCTTSPY